MLTEQQVDFIDQDLLQKGIVNPDLRANLLDHIACLLEQHEFSNEVFYGLYQDVVKRFYSQHIQEIEEETQLLLTFKNYYTMKKLMLFCGVGATSILGLGIVFKFMYWPGAAVLIASGILLLSLVFLPLYFTLKIKEEKQARNKLLTGLTSLVCIGFSLATLFKVMHWPGTNLLVLITLGVLLLIYLPLYFITGIRVPEQKVNTVLTSIMILAGSSLFLTLTRSPRATELERTLITHNLSRSELILQGELSLFYKQQQQNASSIPVQLVAACEKLKTAIVYEETGCNKLLVDNGCVAAPFADGPLSDYTNGNPDFYRDMQHLTQLIENYNQSIRNQTQRAIPTPASMLNTPQHGSLSETVMYFIQVELMVLQNERMLIAAK